MDREKVEKDVIEALRWHFNYSRIFGYTVLNDFISTPLDDMELIMVIEEAVGIELNAFPEDIKTVDDLVGFIWKQNPDMKM